MPLWQNFMPISKSENWVKGSMKVAKVLLGLRKEHWNP